MPPTPDEIEAAARAEEELRKQQEGPASTDPGGPLDGLAVVGDAIAAVAEGAVDLLGAIGSVFDGF